MTLPRINGEFNVVMEPTVRFAGSGNCVLTLRLKAAKRVRDSNGTWSEGPTPLFIDCTMFGKPAENAGDSIKKGHTVVVDGVLEQQEWVDKESGEKRVKVAILADSVGLSTRWNKVTVEDPESRTLDTGHPQNDTAEAPF